MEANTSTLDLLTDWLTDWINCPHNALVYYLKLVPGFRACLVLIMHLIFNHITPSLPFTQSHQLSFFPGIFPFEVRLGILKFFLYLRPKWGWSQPPSPYDLVVHAIFNTLFSFLFIRFNILSFHEKLYFWFRIKQHKKWDKINYFKVKMLFMDVLVPSGFNQWKSSIWVQPMKTFHLGSTNENVPSGFNQWKRSIRVQPMKTFHLG